MTFAYKSLASPDGTLVTVPSWRDDAALVSAAASNAAVQGALEANEDAYWLLLLRSAVFCGGRPNQDFLLGRGCVCVPGAVCSEGAETFSTLQFVALAVIMVVCVINIAWSSWQVTQDIAATLSLVSSVMTAINVSRNVPAFDLSVRNQAADYAPPASVTIDSWLKSK